MAAWPRPCIRGKEKAAYLTTGGPMVYPSLSLSIRPYSTVAASVRGLPAISAAPWYLRGVQTPLV